MNAQNNPTNKLDFTGIKKPVSIKFVLICISVVPLTLLALAGIFYLFFLITGKWDYLFSHPFYLALSIGLILIALLFCLTIKANKNGISALLGDQPENLAIYEKLNNIHDKEQRKEVGLKIIGDKIQNQTWLDNNSRQNISKSWNKGNWFTFAFCYVKAYIKSAWYGKVTFGSLFLFCFLLIPNTLELIAKLVPVLALPIGILTIPYLVWWFVAAWRCAFNTSSGRWIGYLNRTAFVILPIVGLLIALYALLLVNR